MMVKEPVYEDVTKRYRTTIIGKVMYLLPKHEVNFKGSDSSFGCKLKSFLYW